MIEIESKWICEECGKEFEASNDAQLHAKNDHLIDEGKEKVELRVVYWRKGDRDPDEVVYDTPERLKLAIKAGGQLSASITGMRDIPRARTITGEMFMFPGGECLIFLRDSTSGCIISPPFILPPGHTFEFDEPAIRIERWQSREMKMGLGEYKKRYLDKEGKNR